MPAFGDTKAGEAERLLGSPACRILSYLELSPAY